MVNTYFVVQYVFVFILLAEFMYVLARRVSDVKELLLLLYIVVIIDEVGYLLQIVARTRLQIVQAEKFSYLGKPFIVFLVLLLALEVFGYKFSQWIFFVFAGIQLSIVFMMFAFEHNKIFCINMTKCTSFGYLVTAIFFTIDALKDKRKEFGVGVKHGFLSVYALLFVGYLLKETEVIGYDTSMPTDVLMLQVLIIVYIKYLLPDLERDFMNAKNKESDRRLNTSELVNISECGDFTGMFIIVNVEDAVGKWDIEGMLKSIIRSDDMTQNISDSKQAVFAMDVSDEKEATVCLERILQELKHFGVSGDAINMGAVFCDGEGKRNFMQIYDAAEGALKISQENSSDNFVWV